MLRAPSSQPAAAQGIYGCKPNTVFGVGPLGIYAIYPQANTPYYVKIKSLSGGKTIAAGFGPDELYVTPSTTNFIA